MKHRYVLALFAICLFSLAFPMGAGRAGSDQSELNVALPKEEGMRRTIVLSESEFSAMCNSMYSYEGRIHSGINMFDSQYDELVLQDGNSVEVFVSNQSSKSSLNCFQLMLYDNRPLFSANQHMMEMAVNILLETAMRFGSSAGNQSVLHGSLYSGAYEVKIAPYELWALSSQNDRAIVPFYLHEKNDDHAIFEDAIYIIDVKMDEAGKIHHIYLFADESVAVSYLSQILVDPPKGEFETYNRYLKERSMFYSEMQPVPAHEINIALWQARKVRGAKYLVSFGPHIWQVLDTDEKHQKALLITDDIIRMDAYDRIVTDRNGMPYGTSWDSSLIQGWLNDNFYRRFTEAEAALIIADNTEVGGTGDNVFLLSNKMASSLFTIDGQRVASFEGKPVRWWLRDRVGWAPDYEMSYVSSAGSLGSYAHAGYLYGIRPCIYVDITRDTLAIDLEIRRKRENAYSEAERLLASGDVEGAIAGFQSLADVHYENADERVLEATYELARIAREEEAYDEAIRIYYSIGEYKDSSMQINETKYQKATKLLTTGAYTEAQVIFEELGDFKDAKQRVEDAIYAQRPEGLIQEGRTAEALKNSMLTNDEAIIEQTRGMIYEYGNQQLEQAYQALDEADSSSAEKWIKHLGNAYDAFRTIGDYKIAPQQADILAIHNYMDLFLHERKPIVPFGDYRWQIIDVKSEKLLLISDEIVAEMKFGNDTEWESSSLRAWLNSDFLDSFGKKDRDRICLATLPDVRTSNVGDYVFLLSKEEALQYFPDDEARIAQYSESLAVWWLRTNYMERYREYIDTVHSDGRINVYQYEAYDNGGGVRPALWVDGKDISAWVAEIEAAYEEAVEQSSLQDFSSVDALSHGMDADEDTATRIPIHAGMSMTQVEDALGMKLGVGEEVVTGGYRYMLSGVTVMSAAVGAPDAYWTTLDVRFDATTNTLYDWILECFVEEHEASLERVIDTLSRAYGASGEYNNMPLWFFDGQFVRMMSFNDGHILLLASDLEYMQENEEYYGYLPKLLETGLHYNQ